MKKPDRNLRKKSSKKDMKPLMKLEVTKRRWTSKSASKIAFLKTSLNIHLTLIWSRKMPEAKQLKKLQKPLKS
jgi:hypothetical protein